MRKRYSRSINVRRNVDMLRASYIVTWVQGSELDDPFAICSLEATMKGGIDIACNGHVSISWAHDAAVHAGWVCMPEVDHDVGCWLAGRNIDDLNIDHEIHSCLGLPDIWSNEFPCNIKRPFGSFWD